MNALILLIYLTEIKYGLPPGLLMAIVLHEIGGQWQVSMERIGGCSVGPAQIYFPDCNQRHRTHQLEDNLAAGARILQRSHKLCIRYPKWKACKHSLWALYNARSPVWWHNVNRIWTKLMARYAD